MLTPSGERVLEHCVRILDSLLDLAAVHEGTTLAPRGPLRIGAMEVFSIELLPSAISELVALHPDVVPQSYEMIPQRMSEHLLGGEIDVGFTIGARPQRGIDLVPLGTSNGVLVCGRDHPLYARGRIEPAQLLRHPSVVPRFFGTEALPSLDQFPEHRYPRAVGATIELLEMAVALVQRGRFLGYFPEISVRTHLHRGALKALRGLKVAPPFELHALIRSARAPKPAACAVIDILSSKVADRMLHPKHRTRTRAT
jgi:DNA-binding transcriptional LysR family regulator